MTVQLDQIVVLLIQYLQKNHFTQIMTAPAQITNQLITNQLDKIMVLDVRIIFLSL
jgi:hypothetical protein